MNLLEHFSQADNHMDEGFWLMMRTRKYRKPPAFLVHSCVLSLSLSIASGCALRANAVPAQDSFSMEKQSELNAQVVLKKLKDEVRKGDEKAALATIVDISKMKPPLPKYSLSEAGDFLIDRKRFELTKKYLELLPQAEPGWGYVFVREWADASGKDARKISEIDAWLKTRSLSNKTYWMTQRVGLADYCDRKPALFREMESDCKRNPGDLASIGLYIESCSSHFRTADMEWIAQQVHPKLAYDNFRLADWLQNAYPAQSIIFLERARSIPFTAQDDKAIRDASKNWAIANLPPSSWKETFNYWVRSMLAQCYQKTGSSVKAQALLLELSKEQKSSTPYIALSQFAGLVQGSTPTHPLEDQIKKAEPANQNTVSYWRGRASYYEGRKDAQKQKEALEKALSLTAKGVDTDQNAAFERSMVAWDYARFLMVNKSDAQAVAFLWSEFEKYKSRDYQTRILRDISQHIEKDDTGYLKPTDERIWIFLADQPQWDLFEQSLLWRLAKNAGSKNQGMVFQRAEKLASLDASRQYHLGWVMNRCNEPKRSLPLLQAACKGLPKDKQSEAYFALFESYLDLSDWRGAEKVWTPASAQLTESERPNWMGRIAVAAAKSGDKADALRLWKNKDEVDLAYIGHLDELAKLGMKSDLIKYYTQMKKAKPSSTTPAEALKILAEV